MEHIKGIRTCLSRQSTILAHSKPTGMSKKFSNIQNLSTIKQTITGFLVHTSNHHWDSKKCSCRVTTKQQTFVHVSAISLMSQNHREITISEMTVVQILKLILITETLRIQCTSISQQGNSSSLLTSCKLRPAQSPVLSKSGNE